jgi:hypothetical protein
MAEGIWSCKIDKVMQVLKETRIDRRERLISELCMVQSVKVRLDQANIKNTKFGRWIKLGYCVSPTLLNSYSEYLTSEVLEGFRDFNIGQVLRTVPIPVAERSNARVCGQSLVAIAGLNPAGGHGCLSLVSVMSCQVEVFVTGWSLIQRSPTDCGVSLCVIYKPRARGGPGPRWAVAPETKKKFALWTAQINLWQGMIDTN